jgi:KDO2-lipid IV(A) lauroyltransferase
MFNYFLYRIAQAIALSLPLKVAYSIAVFLADLRFLFAHEDRRNVAGNLKVVFPEKSDIQIKEISKKLFRNFAKYLVDFFRIQDINSDYIAKNVRIKDIHYLDSALAERRGVMLLTAHIGNWELGGVVTSMLGYSFITVALPHKSKQVNEFFNKQRESKGVKALPLGNAAKPFLKTLRVNGFLALVGDREFLGKGILTDFFSRPSIFPLGPAVLSLHTKPNIILGFMLRMPDDKFELVFEKPIDYVVTGDNQKDIKEIILKYKSVFEKYIRLYPDQWFMFRRFWSE